MSLKPAVITFILAQILAVGVSSAQSPKVSGNWKVEITFGNSETRSLLFEAKESGKGSFRSSDPRARVWGAAGTSEAKWTQSADSTVFSGPVEFLIGNIGRDAGTLVLKGKFETGGALAGTARFFPAGQDPNDPKAMPSKSGGFSATRVTDDAAAKPPAP